MYIYISSHVGNTLYKDWPCKSHLRVKADLSLNPGFSLDETLRHSDELH